MQNLLRQGFAKKAVAFAFIVGLVSPSAFAYTSGPADTTSTQVAAVAPQVQNLSVAPSTGSAVVSFNLNTVARSTVWILDVNNQVVKTLLFDTDLGSGVNYTYTWNGTDYNNQPVASGNYKAQVVASNAADVIVQSYPFNFTATGGGTTVIAPVATVSVSPTSFDPTKGQSTTVSYSVSQPASVGVTVKLGGSVIRTLRAMSLQNNGSYSIVWDGKNDSGTTMTPNNFVVEVYASNVAGSDTKTAAVSIVNTTTETLPVLTNVSVSPNPFNPNNENTRTTFTLDKTSTVSVAVMNGSTVVRDIVTNATLSAGTYYYDWNGNNNSGSRVSDGFYTVKVTAQNSAGTTTQTPSVEVRTSGSTGSCDMVTSHYSSPSTFNPNNTSTQIYYSLNRSATVSVRIYRNGVTTKTLVNAESLGSGSKYTYWNGRDYNGYVVSNGAYTYEIKASSSGCADDTETGSIYVTGSTDGNNGDNTYVNDWASTNEDLVKDLRVNPEIFDPSNAERTTVSFNLSNSAKLRVEILDGTTVVKSLRNTGSDKQSSGYYSYTWDGRDYNGNRSRDAVYQVRVMADDGYNTDTDRAYVEVDTDGVIIGFPTQARCAGFKDVSTDSPFCKAIELMSKKKIFEGYSDGTFRPYERINRAETAKVVVLALGYDVTTSSYFGRQYNDTSATAWYAPYLDAAKRNGIATGYPDGSFRPANTINRVELLRVFLEANNVGLNDCSPQPFEDTPITKDTAWYMKYACYAKNNGLMNSEYSNKLYPSEAMTRGDVADLFYDFEMKGLYSGYDRDGYTYTYCDQYDYTCLNNNGNSYNNGSRTYYYDTNGRRYYYDSNGNRIFDSLSNYSTGYNSNDGYYVYRNGRYEWVNY